ncbi:hypothetical protein CRG98_048424 [Punica granatum]|uniref:Uncharacterized protein n=1 Tax=Punica granatum TaxID=22663 RepID=A0A2I0HHL7_PUNGR|nr:hypothetical protein CRG98_048424 [Punica granatum]
MGRQFFLDQWNCGVMISRAKVISGNTAQAWAIFVQLDLVRFIAAHKPVIAARKLRLLIVPVVNSGHFGITGRDLDDFEGARNKLKELAAEKSVNVNTNESRVGFRGARRVGCNPVNDPSPSNGTVRDEEIKVAFFVVISFSICSALCPTPNNSEPEVTTKSFNPVRSFRADQVM